MRNRLVLQGLIVPLLLLSSIACSVDKAIPTQELPSRFTLAGQWVVTNDSKLMYEVMYDFRHIDTDDIQLKVWGETANLKGIRKNNDQLIFNYNVGQEDTYSVLVTVLDHDKIKLSRIQESINEFQPLGKLGERVYYLQKRSQGDLQLITKAVK